MGLIDYIKKNTGIGKTVSKPRVPEDVETPPAAQPVPVPQAQPLAPPVPTDPNSEAGQTLQKMKEKYGLKKGGVVKCATGGVIDKELLRRKAAVKQKRGC